MSGNVLVPPWLALISSWQRGVEMSGRWHRPTCTPVQHGSEGRSGERGGRELGDRWHDGGKIPHLSRFN